MATDTWIYQGRQAHGWFGSGTAPKDATTETPGTATPSSLAERVRWIAHGAVAEMPRDQRARFEAQLGRGALKALIAAMLTWIRSAGLGVESFREHFFPRASARASAQIQAFAAAIGHGDDLRPATTALAEAVQVVGLDNVPRFLAAAAEQAASANAPAAAPLPIIKTQVPLILTDPPFILAEPPEEFIPRRIPMERIPGQSGKEAASDIPSYARGIPRYVGETPDEFARRVMDDRWGKGKWEGDDERQKDFRKIKKWGSRAWRNPKSAAPGVEENAQSSKPVA